MGGNTPESVEDEMSEVDGNGVRRWLRGGQLHRGGDLPAVTLPDGTQEWWRNGKLHRGGDQPAVVTPGRTRAWYRDGKRHRDGNLPAVIMTDGSLWFRHGLLHCATGPAYVADGRADWYFEGGRLQERPLFTKLAETLRFDALEWLLSGLHSGAIPEDTPDEELELVVAALD